MSDTAAIAVTGDTLTITFDRFDLDAYPLFIRTKTLPESQVAYDWQTDRYTVTTAARFAELLGVPAPPARAARPPLSNHLFDYQRWAVELALDAKRFALWADTGLGKTAMYLEWAWQVHSVTGGKVLILAPLAVIPQTVAEARRFYGDGMAIARLDSREALVAWLTAGDGFAITNYEKFIPGTISELRNVAGLVADECFVAGTPVDTPSGPVPIERLKPGDTVCNAAGTGTVVATKEQGKSRAVIVNTDNGHGIISSEQHPYLTARGWVCAADLREGDELVTQPEAVRVLRDDVHAEDGADAVLFSELRREMAGIPAERAQGGRDVDGQRGTQPAPLFMVWPGDDPSEFEYAVLQPVVCREMAHVAAGSAGAGRGTAAAVAVPESPTAAAVRSLWIDIRRPEQESDTAVLQSPVLGTVADATAGDSGEGAQPGSGGEAWREEARMVRGGHSGGAGGEGTHRQSRPDEEPGIAREDGGDAATHRPPSAVARWQGPWPDEAAADAVGSARRRVGLRDGRAGQAEGGRAAELPVHRRGASRAEDRDRGGRHVASHAGLAGPGRAEDGVPRIVRVDRVEVLESDDPRLDGHRAEDGRIRFFDLRVDTHPSFSVHGLLVHNSGILKTGGGKIKWNLIKSARGIEYKLSCTATPAPNEAMEYASQAAFLEKLRTEGDILWTYFQRDKYGAWFVKPHARQAFYRFMASWSLYMRDPAAFGFGDILATLPPPVLHEERIPLTDEQRRLLQDFAVRSGKGLFATDTLGVKERAKFAQIARGFMYEGTGPLRAVLSVDARKPRRVAEIARAEMNVGRRVLIWTTFEAEGGVLADLLEDDRDSRVAILTGSQSQEERQALLDRFREGDVRCLISKPSLIGYGLNLQFVTSMIFSGIDDSMERRYQAIRRAYRFGQTEPVHVWTPYVPELEGVMFDNVAAKEARFLEEVAAQEAHYRDALGMAGDR